MSEDRHIGLGARIVTLAWGALAVALASACADPGGFRVDAGPGAVDGGPPPRDAGPRPDGGPGGDAGRGEDAGAEIDAGAEVDAGPGADGGAVTFEGRAIDDAVVHGQGIELRDLDGDGDLDVLAALSLTDAVHLYRNEGRGARWTRIEVAARGSVVAMDTAAADLDGDGDLDVAAIGLFTRAGGFGSPGELGWYENPGRIDGAWVPRAITGRTFWAPRALEAGDLTGDGRSELVVGTLESSDGQPTAGLSWFRRQGAGWSAPQRLDPGLRGISSLLLHDVDADGATDVVAVGTGSGEVVWYENLREPGTPSDSPAFARHVVATAPAPHDVRLAQLDGDVALELVVSVQQGSGAVMAYDPPSEPRGPWPGRVLVPDFGGSDRVRLAAADLDGDGVEDLAVSSYPAQEVRAYLARPGGLEARTVTTGYAGLNGLAAGDLDGDGRADLVTSTYEQAAGRDAIAWWRSRP